MKEENKEEFLKENGFKKIEFRDKSSYWWEKKFKLGEFNAKFYYDGKFCTIDIRVIVEPVGIRELGLYESIWSGDWRGFKQKIKKYEKNIKK
jgi:glucan biosynthesis protein